MPACPLKPAAFACRFRDPAPLGYQDAPVPVCVRIRSSALEDEDDGPPKLPGGRFFMTRGSPPPPGGDGGSRRQKAGGRGCRVLGRRERRPQQRERGLQGGQAGVARYRPQSPLPVAAAGVCRGRGRIRPNPPRHRLLRCDRPVRERAGRGSRCQDCRRRRGIHGGGQDQHRLSRGPRLAGQAGGPGGGGGDPRGPEVLEVLSIRYPDAPRADVSPAVTPCASGRQNQG